MRGVIVKSRNAFTLVELLVVITILTLLIGLLLPSLQNAHEAAARTKCLVGTRMLAIAARSYQDSAQGYFPSYLTVAGNVIGSPTHGVQKGLVDGGYTTQDSFTDRACPYGPAQYSDTMANYYYDTADTGNVAMGLNEELQEGNSFINPTGNTYWTPSPLFTPQNYVFQGPFNDSWKRVRQNPTQVMVASCCLNQLAGLISCGHTMGYADAYFAPGTVLPTRHRGEGLPWTFYDGHGAFIPFALVAPYPLTAQIPPYQLWEWTWYPMFVDPGMDN